MLIGRSVVPRVEHIAFYRRVFGATVWRSPRDYPGLTAKLACVGADYRAARQLIESRYPFFKSEPGGERILVRAGQGRTSDVLGVCVKILGAELVGPR